MPHREAGFPMHDCQWFIHKKAPVSFPTGAHSSKIVQKSTVNGSADDGFSAADIAESESEESGDQGDLKTAGERLAHDNFSSCHTKEAESNCHAF